jgi:hypothetical protein
MFLLLTDSHFVSQALDNSKYEITDYELISTSHEDIKKRIRKLYAAVQFFQVGDLFEVRYGVPELRYSKEIPHGVTFKEVVFLRPSMLREIDGTLKSLEEIRKITDREQERMVSGAMELPPVNQKHILQKNDLLINNKGIPKLIDIFDGVTDFDIQFVPTPHFFVLSPKTNVLNALQIDLEFLKYVLKHVVKTDLFSIYETQKLQQAEKIYEIRSTNKARSSASILPALQKEQLMKLKIAVPERAENQERVKTILDNIKKAQNSVAEKFNLWNLELSAINLNQL